MKKKICKERYLEKRKELLKEFATESNIIFSKIQELLQKFYTDLIDKKFQAKKLLLPENLNALWLNEKIKNMLGTAALFWEKNKNFINEMALSINSKENKQEKENDISINWLSEINYVKEVITIDQLKLLDHFLFETLSRKTIISLICPLEEMLLKDQIILVKMIADNFLIDLIQKEDSCGAFDVFKEKCCYKLNFIVSEEEDLKENCKNIDDILSNELLECIDQHICEHHPKHYEIIEQKLREEREKKEEIKQTIEVLPHHNQ